MKPADTLHSQDAAAEILKAREQREKRMQALLEESGMPLLIIRANFPGRSKQNLYSNLVASVLYREIFAMLALRDCEIVYDAAGLAFFLPVPMEAHELKRKMITIEETHPLGRLADLDVMDRQGEISRTGLQYPERNCFLCDKRAVECVRSRAHPAEDVRDHFLFVLFSWLYEGNRILRFRRFLLLGGIAELSRRWSFGCVSFSDSGSHNDMDALHFIDSLFGISDEIGRIRWTEHTEFDALRRAGKQLESRMCKETGGINTHRGLIFFAVLLLDAYLHTHRFQDLSGWIRDRARPLAADFSGRTVSHGLNIYRTYGITGARGMAMDGLARLFTEILPAFRAHRSLLQLTLDWMAGTDDTTAIHRSGLENWRRAAGMAAAFSVQTESPAQLDEYCLATGMSTGGVADLVTITLIAACMEEAVPDKDSFLRRLTLD